MTHTQAQFDHELHKRRVSPVNSQLPSGRRLVAIEPIDGPLPILTFLEHHDAEPHAGSSRGVAAAAADLIGEPGHVPHHSGPNGAKSSSRSCSPKPGGRLLTRTNRRRNLRRARQVILWCRRGQSPSSSSPLQVLGERSPIARRRSCTGRNALRGVPIRRCSSCLGAETWSRP